MGTDMVGPGGTVTISGEVEVRNDVGAPVPVTDTQLAGINTVLGQRALETTLQLVLAKLLDIYAAVDGLEVTAGNIEISSETINLQTDEVEALLQAVRDRLPAALDPDGGAKVHLQNPTLSVSGPLTDAQLRASAVPARDDYQAGEVLADQTGAGGVLAFTFGAPVQLVVIDANGAATDVARADPFGGVPAATAGVPCRDEVPTFMPVTTSTVQVWAPPGMVVSCYGYRRG